MIRSALRSALLFIATLLVAVLPAAADQEALSGAFYGIDEAQGMAVELRRQGGGWSGALRGIDGKSYAFEAQPAGAGAQGEISWAGGSGILRLSPKPIGLMLVWVPFDGAGTPDANRARTFAFVRQGVELPPMPSDYTPPPPPGATDIAGGSFLRSYEFWPPEDVGRGYALLDERDKALIRLFSRVQTDILWKICGASSIPEGLAEALRGQGVTCDDVLTGIAAAQRNGRFSAYKRSMWQDRSVATHVVECARGIHRTALCAQAAQATQARSIAMESVASTLAALSR